MIVQELAQRAVLEALEGKIEALKGSGELREGMVLELVLWDDLSINFPSVFMAAAKEEIALAISQATEKSNGRFTLETIKPSTRKRSGVFYAATGVSESVAEEAPLLFWRIRYSEKYKLNNLLIEKEHIFWLTPETLIYKPSDKVAVCFHKKDAVNYKLLKFFANHDGKTDRKDIATEIGTTPENVSVEVSKLRKAVHQSIGLGEKAFIVSEPGYGLEEHIKIEER
ncbi:MAG: hypothetical protein WC217_01275 [Candidatus Paceibacterota bacterium]|jgi:hypothetical protein